MSLKAVHIWKNLGDPPQEILKDISFEICPGEFVALKGRSGSGKSTLLYILSTLDNPSRGAVVIDDQEVGSMSATDLHRFRNEKIGFVFQFHYLLPELSALDNVLMPARKAGLEKEKTAYAKELLGLFELDKKHASLPKQLSGGQNQRVAIARAMVMKPAYIFADEPTGSLDSLNSERVFEIFQQINREFKTTIVMVTHDDELSSRAGRVIDLKDGRLTSDPASQVVNK